MSVRMYDTFILSEFQAAAAAAAVACAVDGAGGPEMSPCRLHGDKALAEAVDDAAQWEAWHAWAQGYVELNARAVAVMAARVGRGWWSTTHAEFSAEKYAQKSAS